MKVFSAKKMIARLRREGRVYAVTDEIVAIMKNLDGCEARTNCWDRIVHGDPVLWCVGRDGEGSIVNENDCVLQSEWEEYNG